MTPLTGVLIAFPMPNKTGCWAYRQLDDGQLLETELTKTEWLTLHNAATKEENSKIQELNTHPLNVAALELLNRAKSEPGGPGALKPLYVLSLAELALPNWEEDQGPWLRLANWTRDFSRMEAAMLKLIDTDLDARELLRLSPMEAAKQTCVALGVL